MMSAFTGALVVCLGIAACNLADRLAVSPCERGKPSLDPMLAFLRVAVFIVLLVLWLGLSGRICFSAVATPVTVAVFAAISREKEAYLAEPLVFSDVSFLTHLPRHPEMFYLGAWQILGFLAGVAALLALILAWVWIEPRTMSWAIQCTALALALAAPCLACWNARALSRRLQPALTIMREQSPFDFVNRLGLLSSMAVGTIGWLAESDALSNVTCLSGPVTRSDDNGRQDHGGVDVVVVVQAESFTDLRRVGMGLSLPHHDALADRAFMRGRLEVPCFGAYTMRPEFGVISGVPFMNQGLGRFHPYLRPERFAARSLPAELRRHGWHTVFLHPHDARFFARDRAIPALGFDRFVGEDAFGSDTRFGPYVSDAAVKRKLVEEIKAATEATRKLFIMAVTMETHDPYGPGRLAATDDPVEQYRIHLNHADVMLGALVEALDLWTRRSVLLFYGDHAPLLPGYANLADDTDTDYIALDCGRAISLPIEPAMSSRRRPDELNVALRKRLGLCAVAERDLPTDT